MFGKKYRERLRMVMLEWIYRTSWLMDEARSKRPLFWLDHWMIETVGFPTSCPNCLFFYNMSRRHPQMVSDRTLLRSQSRSGPGNIPTFVAQPGFPRRAMEQSCCPYVWSPVKGSLGSLASLVPAPCGKPEACCNTLITDDLKLLVAMSWSKGSQDECTESSDRFLGWWGLTSFFTPLIDIINSYRGDVGAAAWELRAEFGAAQRYQQQPTRE